MSNEAAVAGKSRPIPKQSQRDSQPKTKTQPPYAVIVLNDNIHSFQHVVETFTKVFGYSTEKSYALALQIHNAGKGIVWSGVREVAELKCDQIRSAGHDFNGVRAIETPLAVTVEPLPG
jgi:ATP-dependent Clp protease adaptor protein ClpS